MMSVPNDSGLSQSRTVLQSLNPGGGGKNTWTHTHAHTTYQYTVEMDKICAQAFHGERSGRDDEEAHASRNIGNNTKKHTHGGDRHP